MISPKSIEHDGETLKTAESTSCEAHIWHASIQSSESNITHLSGVLSEEEMQRADRFYFDKDRKRFIVSRGILRLILSDYCADSPEKHEFVLNPFGKPLLSGNAFIRFNVSHAGDTVLLGVVLGREIGVDVEVIRPFDRAEQIVERFFSEQEKIAFFNLPVHLREEAFFNCWTRKEAYIKAVGKGMSIPLDQFTITFLPGEPARLLEVPLDEAERDSWTMQAVPVTPGYAAAAVAEGRNVLFKVKEWVW